MRARRRSAVARAIPRQDVPEPAVVELPAVGVPGGVVDILYVGKNGDFFHDQTGCSVGLDRYNVNATGFFFVSYLVRGFNTGIGAIKEAGRIPASTIWLTRALCTGT